MSSNRNLALRVESLGKRYVVPERVHHSGNSRRAAISQHLKEFFPRLLGRDERDYFWAIRDLSFDVEMGEIVGIIGKNGSGKSTLLKILSGVTVPSEGRAITRGRVGSLLEVGTGFHPDLSGRENVFLNGALLGIQQGEIRAKFDEIVEFADVGQFIDVPVKRYSSGMYVRLAYAVASMLRSDILILDEVLAVGDAEFREKSQRNMEASARSGRTILFVSHNTRAVRDLCHRAIVLKHGKIVFEGDADEACNFYLRDVSKIKDSKRDLAELPAFVDLSEAVGFFDSRDQLVINSIETIDAHNRPSRVFQVGAPMTIRIGYEHANRPSPYFTVMFHSIEGERVSTHYSTHQRTELRVTDRGIVECRLDAVMLAPGEYSIMIDFGDRVDGFSSLDCVPDATQIRVELGDYLGPPGFIPGQGFVAQSTTWTSHPTTRESQST